jgi:Arc/MetJ-type ribon-helix-helix transcriptional regulator
VTVTFRFPVELERRIDAYARSRGLSRSSVVRSALDRMLTEETESKDMTLSERLAPWIGAIDSGGRSPARDHKKTFADVVLEKHRARRPR